MRFIFNKITIIIKKKYTFIHTIIIFIKFIVCHKSPVSSTLQ